MAKSKTRKDLGPLEAAFGEALTAVARQDSGSLETVLAREPKVVECRDPEDRKSVV